MISIRSTILLLGLAAAIACDNDPANADDDGGTTMETAVGTDEGECTPGYEGCACVEGGACLGDLTCLSNLCVSVPSDDTTSAAPVDTGDEESSAAHDDDESSSGALSAGEDTGETTSDDAESSSAGEESSTTEPEPECLEGDNYCAEAEHQTCVDGQWVTSTCEENCNLVGYHSTGCENADACLCDGFANDECFNGAAGYCLCDTFNGCDDPWLYELYDFCIAGEPILDCYATFLDPDTYDIDCAAAEAACL